MKIFSKSKVVSTALALTVLTASLAPHVNVSASSTAPMPTPNTKSKPVTYKLPDSVNPPGTLPISKQTVNLTIAVPQHANVSNYSDNEFTTLIEKAGNVKLKWDLYPAGSEGTQKLQILIASRAPMPDILMGFGINDDNTYNYGKNGIIKDLTPYFEGGLAVNYDKYVPTISMGEDMYRALHKSVDDKYYYIPSLSEGYIGNLWTSKAVVNKNFLTAVNMKPPKTTDELYNVLKAFKEKDPNKNGKADEIPMLGSITRRQDIKQWVMSAFIYNDPSGTVERLISTDGKLSVAYNTPEWRDGIRYLNKLYTEGLLSPLSFSQNNNQMFALVGAKEATVGFIMPGNNMGSLNNMANDRAFDYIGLLPVKGPKGVQTTTYYGTKGSNAWSITKDCKNPEVAFMLGDYMWDEEIAITGRYGVKDRDWKVTTDKSVNPLGQPYKYEMIKNFWGSVQNIHWQDVNPTLHSSAFSLIMKPAPADPRDPDPTRFDIFNDLSKYGPKEPIILIKYNEKEQNDLRDIRANLQTYVNESFDRFVTGDMKIEADWDAYLKELDKIGVKKFVETSQKAWDRMNGK